MSCASVVFVSVWFRASSYVCVYLGRVLFMLAFCFIVVVLSYVVCLCVLLFVLFGCRSVVLVVCVCVCVFVVVCCVGFVLC